MSTLNFLNEEGRVTRVDINTSSKTFLVSAKLNFMLAFSKFSQKTLLCTLSHSIHELRKRFFFLFYIMSIILP